MSENREEILANFQSITAIDDLGIAIHHLEEANWDLLTAIHRVIPQDGPNLLSRDSMAYEPNFANFNNLNSFDVPPHFGEDDITDLTAEQQLPPAQPMDLIETASSSSSSGPKVTNNGFFPPQNSFEDKILQFSIHYNSQVYDLTINNRSTIEDLKTKINDLTGVPNCRQALKGWPTSKQREAQINTTVLRSLHLLAKTSLYLTDLTAEGFLGDGDVLAPSTSKAAAAVTPTTAVASTSNVNYTLHINLQPAGQIHKLKFPEKQTVLSVKTDVYTVTNIPVRHQVWSGWPNNVSDSKTLGELGIEFEHNLVLQQSNDTNKPINTTTTAVVQGGELPAALAAVTTTTASSSAARNRAGSSVIEIDSDSSLEEFEDASEDFNPDDDMFSESPAQPRIKHLIPDNCDDETIGCLQFIENFTERYGQHNRIFFEGCLEDALKEACHKPARQRKLLAIYLHHDGSVLSNVFCGQLLGCESIIQVLLEHFVVYGWDLTYESNKNMFLSSISACVNHTAQMTVRNIPVDKLPAILIVSRNRSICEVFSVIYGNVGVDDLLSQLLEFTELYSEQLKTDIREENERNARESIKFEQDAAYQESLEADRAKEEARKQKELMIATERQRLESEKAESEAKRAATMAQAASTLPAEPAANAEKITKIRVRTANGMLERRFTVDTKLQILLNFITSEGYLQEEHKVLASFPRRDLTTFDPEATLETLKLYPQETVILEER